jgi:hypothetical protein
MSTPAVQARGFGLPFSGFSTTATLAQALRPYPQFSSGLTARFSPLGTTNYNSLQAKVTKRFSHGIDATYSFTYQKTMQFGSNFNDVFNRAANSVLDGGLQPLQSVIAFTYTVPKIDGINGILAYALYDWQIGSILTYASGLPIPVPTAQNNLGNITFQGNTFANRVPGVPLFLKDLDSGIDPREDFVPNPDAWTQPAVGEFGVSAPFYSDYRFQRRPSEAMNFGRNVRFGEQVTVQARVEFTNIFNRAQPANPSATNALQTQVKSTTGGANVGFGSINFAQTGQNPRQGQLVLRLSF